MKWSSFNGPCDGLCGALGHRDAQESCLTIGGSSGYSEATEVK